MTLRLGPHFQSGLGYAAFLQFFFCVLLAVAIPKATTISLAILVFGSLIVILIHSFGQSSNFWVPPKQGFWLILLPLLVAVSSYWSEDPKSALIAAATLAFVLVASLIILRATTIMAGPVIRGCQYGLMVGVSVAVALAAIDVATEQGLTKVIFAFWPSLPEAATRHVIIQDGVASFVSEATPNRRAIILVCLLPAFIYCAFKLRPSALSLFWILLGGLGFTVLLVHTLSLTAQVACFAGALCLIISKYCDRRTMLVLTTAWATAWIAAVPAAILLADFKVQEFEFLPPSAAARVQIWSSVAAGVFEKPIFGHGVGSHATFTVNGSTGAEASAQHQIHHPHNGYLQIWYELGLIGALMFFVGGAWLLRAIAFKSSEIRPYMYAAFTIGACIMLTGFGLWQHWLLSVIALGFAFVWVVSAKDRLKKDEPERSGSQRV